MTRRTRLTAPTALTEREREREADLFREPDDDLFDLRSRTLTLRLLSAIGHLTATIDQLSGLLDERLETLDHIEHVLRRLDYERREGRTLQ